MMFRLIVACLFLAGCSSDTEPAGFEFEETPTDTAPQDTPPRATPEDFFTPHEFDAPGPTDCRASSASDADYKCTTTFQSAVGVVEVTESWFDRWGQLVLVEAQDGKSEFEYDCAGNLVHAINDFRDGRTEIVNTYDGGLLVRSVTTDEWSASTETTDYAYDDAGRIAIRTDRIAEDDGTVDEVVIRYEYAPDGTLLRETESTGRVTEYWIDERGVAWEGEPDGCAFGLLDNANGHWVESHVRDCPAFGEGHRIVRMDRDEWDRPLQVTGPDGNVTERHEYEGLNPYPTHSWREYVGSSIGSETSTFEYEFTDTSLSIRAVNEATGAPAGTVRFDGVPCFPDEIGLRAGWMYRLAIPAR